MIRLKKYSEYVEVSYSPGEVIFFDGWLAHNGTAMANSVRIFGKCSGNYSDFTGDLDFSSGEMKSNMEGNEVCVFDKGNDESFEKPIENWKDTLNFHGLIE